MYQKCGPHVLASCNCAVAVQSGDDVIVIERCLRRKKWFRRISGSEESVNRMRVDMYVNGNLTRGTRVLQEADGKKYNVRRLKMTKVGWGFRVGREWIFMFTETTRREL